MTLNAGASVVRVVITSNIGPAAADGRSWILFEGRGFQVGEVTGRQLCGAVTSRTIISPTYHVQPVPTGNCVVIFSLGLVPIQCLVAGGTLRVDIDRAAGPGRCGLSAVASDAGAGAAVAAGGTAHGVEARQNADLGVAVVMAGAIMAGGTARAR